MADTRDWFVDGSLEVREGRAGEPTTLIGYAAVFGREAVITQRTDDGVQRWREVIAPTAFDAVIGRADVIAAINHDSKLVLGRSRAGTLALSTDGVGLRYEVKLPNTQLARDTVENVRNGNYAGSSFKFEASRGGLKLTPASREGQLPLIVIDRVDDLIDVGPVTFPAYDGTSVSVRSGMGDLLKEHDACVRALAETARRERLKLRIAIERAKAWA